MKLKNIFIVAVCCVTATTAMATEPNKSKKEKAQPMSEPNPVQAYVNVVPQGGEGRDTSFILCEHSQKGCEKPVRTKKHLAVSNNSTQIQVGTAKKNNNLPDY
ncbi:MULTISPECIES: hypothetical protein [Acinetobacter]|uniref:hypothetical protein n=1 Tax=Acinetobacter TaxID=469 RepID=UPI0007430D3B|nr:MULTISPECIES: hypothetical protein [Acinetobacter]ALY01412.1 hypothetical protein KBNAB1_3906 [Acinetobacter baumannii]MBE2718355.1 hypothetical protein [Acinetobacter baumannii]MBP4413428.1 hypothetical protein [Acinetobacter baumannii]MBV6768731.1 hypothetical protein [Acinetobacter baumannii]MDH1007031.1 hypothetical protein [Acinetobacter junii]